MPRRASSKLVAGGIVLLWLVMMGLLLKREVFVPVLDTGAYQRLQGPRDTWMGIFDAGDRQIGFMNVRAAPQARNGLEGTFTQVRSTLSLMLLKQPTKITISGTTWMPVGEGIGELSFRLETGGHHLRLDARLGEGRFEGKLYTAGQEIPINMPLATKDLMVNSMGALIHVPDLEQGREYLIDTLDPTTLSLGKARIKYVRDERLAFDDKVVDTRVLEVTTAGMTTHAWINGANEVVKAETPLGLYIREISPDKAVLSEAPPVESDLAAMTAVHPSGKTVFRGAKRMVYRLGGTTLDQPVPTDDTQQAIGPDTYQVAQLDPPAAYPADTPEGDYAAFLLGDPLIQVDHPRIQQAARDIVAGEPDRWKAALRIYTWVYEKIRKAPVPSIPSALETLLVREGDCNEHTVLFTALARAAGIPTRIAIGVAWSDQFNGFYYHAWPEVYAGKWIWMDPTLGQPVADATHVKLVTGGLEKWVQITPYLGQLQLEILEIE